MALHEARTSVAEQTGLELERHDSSYWGGEYYRASTPNGEVIVHVNADLTDSEPVSTSAVPTTWIIALVTIPGLALGPPWAQVAAT